MKRVSFFLLGMIMGLITRAKEGPLYAVSSIPEDMKTGMYAVIREKESSFFIHSTNSSSHKVRLVITILNSKADDEASLTLGYDKFSKIENLKASVYNEEGHLIKKLKPSEIIDQSSVSDFSLFEDTRLKHINLAQNTYPYTVEFEYTIVNKFLYSIPEFQLYDDDEISIQKTSFAIIYLKTLKPRYKLFKVGEPTISSEADKIEKMSWTFEKIKPEKFESFAPYNAVVPRIIAGPNDFEFDGFVGKMDTWNNLGKWQILLNQGRDQLPEQTKLKVRNLVSGIASQEQKAKVLYEFMQNKTRYVSIQRGIGGFQPFDAKSVDQLGYGDCKALSNYMVALLKEAGIKGYYTQVYAGEKNRRPVPQDFTVDYFNHIIVAIPNKVDTIWLECTSQTAPFGYLGNFTCDRYALMVTDNGGELVKTANYAATQNTQQRIADVHLDISGDAKAKVTTTYSGLKYDDKGLDAYVNSSTDDQKKWIQKYTAIPSFDITSFSMINKKSRVPSATVNMDLNLKRWANVSGKRIFMTPNLMNRSTFLPEKMESRKTILKIPMGYIDVDTIRYHLPDGIYPEFLPEPSKITSRFGEYEASFTLDQGNLIYIRKLKMNKGEFPPESYKEFSEFYKSINKADNSKIVFLSKT